MNLDSAVEQQRHEDAKVGNKGMHGISPKLEAFTWQVNPNRVSNLPLPGFFFASSRLCCSPPIAGFRMDDTKRRAVTDPEVFAEWASEARVRAVEGHYVI
jgi:hypothetical protein